MYFNLLNSISLSTLTLTYLALSPMVTAWEVRILGDKGVVHEDSGLAHYTDCIRLHEPILAEKVKFEARLKGNAALELFADDCCRQKINEQCSDPWMEDYPHVCVGSYKVGLDNSCRAYD